MIGVVIFFSCSIWEIELKFLGYVVEILEELRRFGYSKNILFG